MTGFLRVGIAGACFLICACGDMPERTRAADARASSDAGGACYPANACTTGPSCGDACCNSGERCVEGACRCGDNDPCGAGDFCVTGGPVLATHEGCGLFCCGASAPCPI